MPIQNSFLFQKLQSGLPDGSNDITAIQADLTNEESVLKLFREIEQKFGHADVLVNNAGCLDIAPLSCGKTESWRQMLDVSFNFSLALVGTSANDFGQIHSSSGARLYYCWLEVCATCGT